MSTTEWFLDSFFLWLSKRTHLAERRREAKEYCGNWICVSTHWTSTSATHEDYRRIVLKRNVGKKRELELINSFSIGSVGIHALIEKNDPVLVRMRDCNDQPCEVSTGLNDVLVAELISAQTPAVKE